MNNEFFYIFLYSGSMRIWEVVRRCFFVFFKKRVEFKNGVFDFLLLVFKIKKKAPIMELSLIIF